MNENKETYIDFEISQWWVDWWREDKHYFCAVVRVGKQHYYIERELEST